MVDIGSGALRDLFGVQLSRCACYLIVQNGYDRTPAQIIHNIQDQGQIGSGALARMNALLAAG